jgi:hypothetical protein
VKLPTNEGAPLHVLETAGAIDRDRRHEMVKPTFIVT